MNKAGPNGPSSRIVTINGEPFYIIGKTRIKITEHFPAAGRSVDELVVGLIANKIREKAGKTA